MLVSLVHLQRKGNYQRRVAWTGSRYHIFTLLYLTAACVRNKDMGTHAIDRLDMRPVSLPCVGLQPGYQPNKNGLVNFFLSLLSL
jgi:hypothetical protein